MSDSPLIWLGALATLALYSILYRENPVYRFAEHVFVGLATGYGLYRLWKDVLQPKWWAPLIVEGQWWWIFAFVAGAMYYTLYFRRLAWMSRMVMVTTMGFTAGQVFRAWAGQYVPQIRSAMMKPLLYQPMRAPYLHLDSLLFVAILVTVLTYFLFSFEHQNLLVRRSAQTGRWVMMIGFGAIFGSTVMARLSLFIGRLVFLFRDWIHWIPQ